MENTEAIWLQRLAKRREGIPWKVIIEAEGFKYSGTVSGHLKTARARGWIPPEETLPPAIRSDGRRQGLKGAKQDRITPEAVVEVVPGASSLDDADTAPPDDVLPIGNMVPVSSEALSPAEVQTLEHYEHIIAQGIETFVEVGQALLAIRDQRLYRQSYTTFEDYLRQRWDLSRSYAHRMIDAAVVVENLLPNGNIVPVNEAQARPLTSLPPEQQQEVWREVVETAPAGKVTAKHVQATVKRVKGASTEPKIDKPKALAPAPQRPPRQRVQDGLFGVLAMVKDEEAWTILGEIALALDTYAQGHPDPNLMERMEQALSPLWHLIEDYQPDHAGEDE